MNWWDVVRDAGDTFLGQHGVQAAFGYLAVEESGVPIPVPGDFLMLALGVRARDGLIVLWQVIAAMEAGTILGSSLLYLLARRGGRGVVERYSLLVGVGAEQLDRAEKQLRRHRRGARPIAARPAAFDGHRLRDLPDSVSRC